MRPGGSPRWWRPSEDALFALALTLNALGLLLWLAGGTRITAADFARIRTGMTRAEVERLLGGPPGYHGRYRFFQPPGVENALRQVGLATHGVMPRVERWKGDGGTIAVSFDPADFVLDASFTPAGPTGQPLRLRPLGDILSRLRPRR
jgi:hypothetical protein